VKVFFLNRELLKKKIRNAVEALAADCPEVQKVVLFGSVAEDRALPSSDIDILLIVDSSEERFIDRPTSYFPYFHLLPIGVDCFVFTREEVQSGQHPIIRTATQQGFVLFERSLSQT
jgi:predicted nucleotidyltransferase